MHILQSQGETEGELPKYELVASGSAAETPDGLLLGAMTREPMSILSSNSVLLVANFC